MDENIIKTYLSDIPKDLLTHDQEIALAKEIEQKQIELLRSILNTAKGRSFFRDWGHKIYHKEIDVTEFTDMLNIISALDRAKAFKLFRWRLSRFLTLLEDTDISKCGIFLYRMNPRIKLIKAVCKKISVSNPTSIKKIENLAKQILSVKQVLIRSNLKLVVSIAKKYIGRKKMLFSDLIQEGNIGLLKAVDKFNYKLGFRFSTYAVWWIRQSIMCAILNQSREIRIPAYVIDTIYHVLEAAKELTRRYKRDPKINEIAKFTKIGENQIKKALNIIKDPISLETTIGDYTNTKIMDFIENPEQESQLDLAINTDLIEDIDDLLKQLTPREEKLLRLRFGIKDQ